jgi:hypothetical protein
MIFPALIETWSLDTSQEIVLVHSRIFAHFSLTPKRPRIHGFKMTALINHIVKHIIQMRLNFVSLESAKHNAYDGQETNKFKQKKVHIEPIQNC